ncbi:ATP-dependent DNA helicase RecG [Anaeromicropila herbilytica]|uniref:ATP-dependent DNA helicase RecG n=1 Tax=Anaeromicropila herbilytica TaxID=2785025 RepID=A0A7R7ID28_9FIRM|nr:ATP-dependent DNA helicase RecG [Anaeromicropila herbilytica]BCN30471.1 ATP-dependent DNA helicase RecG [Anaeromicropila herbilytica]
MNINDRITVLKGIGDKTSLNFMKLGINSVGEMLEHYPRGYDVYEDVTDIKDVMEGKTVTIEATVLKSVEITKVRNLQIINCTVKDATGSIQLKWFNMPFLRNTLKIGYRFIFRGKVVRKNNQYVIEQPQILSKEEYLKKLNILQPIYPLTGGLTNNMIQKMVKQILGGLDLSEDYLPEKIRKQYDLMEYRYAVEDIHFPKNKDCMIEARKRIVFDEFFQFTLALGKLKKEKNINENQFLMKESEDCTRLIENLPYSLTNAQTKVWKEIIKDLSGDRSMNRLIQGDVGSGKTIIAALALLMATKNGYQGSLMVPTEVLAKQHYESIQELFEENDVKAQLLVGSMTAKEKKIAYERIKNHEVNVIIGTHALIQEKVEYDNLALVITDEQHRFGVKQREALKTKGKSPHVLVMSATPIPRTLAIILYGDLDISVIDELPANRLPIKNCVVDTGYRPTAYHFIEKQVIEGRQAYVICPMVEESETMEAENVIEYTEKLREALVPFIKVEYLHGKMKAKEKNDIMERFAANEIHVLVSTTVIEVGVNVPNSTVMLIENAERFGLAQLHQLRGRVGRGKYQSYCILISGSSSKETKERLEILNKSNDGFFIASEDLKLRGPGDMFGIRQSGVMEFKMGDIYTDATILKNANDAAKEITEEELEELCKKNPYLKEKLESFAGNVLI